ncbi:hypothetical protein AMELA_G00158940 [Ameiurus melas]|uniref:protein-tyrosine-phosphatase n=1 Tax=Ameiurus melas TaxID=219545 RepID=A0A7J6AEH9_AMEME|nr:hypothetical protein AMELA_G00158940 [Ameiurus melas]
MSCYILSKNLQTTLLSLFLFQFRSIIAAQGESIDQNAVTSLTVSNKTTSSVSLTWNEPPGNRSFTVNWTCGSVNNSTNTTNTSYTVTGLTAGVNYTFTVTAVSADGQTAGAPTQISAFTKPDAARDLSVTEITTSSLFLNWTEPIGKRSFFKVQWTNDSITLNSTTSNTFFNITNLNPGVNYTILISAVAADNITEGEAVGLPVYTKPETISNLIVLNVTNSSILLDWTEAMGKISYYLIQYENFSITINKTTEITGINIINLTPGVQYTFKVFAIAADNKTEGNYSCILAYTNPNYVTNLTVANKNTSSVSLTWNEPPGNRSYFTVNWTGGSVNNSSNISYTSYTVTGLTAGVNYTFTVTAVAADGQTAGAPTQTSAFTNPNDVTNLTVANKNISSVSLTWNEPPGNRSYFTVNWTDGSENNSSNTSYTSYTVTGLTAGVNYTFTVTAVAADGQTAGEPTQTSAFTNHPNAVTSLTVSNINTSSVSLTWNEPPGNMSYFSVNWTGGSVNNSSNTSNTSYTVTGLTAGVNYTFTVTAVAADDGTGGELTQISAFTKPDIVRSLRINEVTTTSVFLDWVGPLGESSFFRVRWTNSSTTPATAFNITDLTPGTNYTFTVSAVAADNKTEGSLVGLSTCTDASPVFDIICKGPNRTSTALLNLTWTNPPGNNQGFNISLNQTPSVFILPCSPVCNHIFSENFQYFSTYSVIISTLGCGESGTRDLKCTTGITEPSVPSNPVDVAIIFSPISQTVVKLQFSASLLNSTNGPIRAYGVLLSTDQQRIISRNYLTMTYSDWVNKKTKTYLTVLKLNEKISSRSNMITIEIGSNNIADVISNTDYTNGPLTDQNYSVAMVLFTYLEIKDGLVDIQQSIVSVTPFASNILKPLNPSSNTVAVILGVLLPIICIFVIIIFVMLRRLQTHQNLGPAVTESFDLQSTYNFTNATWPILDSPTKFG